VESSKQESKLSDLAQKQFGNNSKKTKIKLANVGVHQVNNNHNGNFHGLGPAGPNEYKEHGQAYVVFETQSNDKQSLYRCTMEVNAVMPVVPKLMYWSDQAMGWDLSDHPKVMPNPGGYAFMMDPTFIGPANNVKFSKVLIDNGNSINIMYQDMMHKLGIKKNMLEPSKTTFHSIVPGLSCSPMGKIRLDVMFGHRDKCWVENLQFEFVDLESPYHALLVGRHWPSSWPACGIPEDEDARTKGCDHHNW
jgi:hypothetical protein